MITDRNGEKDNELSRNSDRRKKEHELQYASGMAAAYGAGIH